MDTQRGFIMIGVIGFHRTYHTQIIDALGHVREQVTYLGSALSMRLKLPLGRFQEHIKIPFSPLKLIHRDRFPGVRQQLRLRIK